MGWIAERAGLALALNFIAIEAIDGDRILGMVGFDGWTPNSCTLHVAIEHPIALRRLIKETFRLVFQEWKRGVLLCSVLSTNTKSIALTRHVGFREKTRILDGWAKGVDVLIFEMRGEVWDQAVQKAALRRQRELGLVPIRAARRISIRCSPTSPTS